jgi:hypothetical protein
MSLFNKKLSTLKKSSYLKCMTRIVNERVITILRIRVAIQTLGVFVSGSVNCEVYNIKIFQ